MHTPPARMAIPLKLSSAWLFFLLTTLFRDIHNFVRPGFVDQVLTGVVNGQMVTDTLLLMGGIAVTLPIALVCLPFTFPRRVNRWTHGGAALLNLIFVAATPHRAIDEMYFAALHVVVLGFILWTALRWGQRYQAI